VEPFGGKVRQMAMRIEMPLRRRLAAGLLLLPLALAACASSSDGSTGAGAPGSPSASTSAAGSSPGSPPVPSSSAGAPGSPATPGNSSETGTGLGKRIVLEKSGGIAGVQETLTVEPDGSWTRTGRKGGDQSGKLTADQVSALRVLLNNAGSLTGPANQKTTDVKCADAFTYKLTVGTESANFADCPNNSAPSAAGQIIAMLATATGTSQK
jgi:hypothetical protein